MNKLTLKQLASVRWNFTVLQDKRKAAIGKHHYSSRKLWEELAELKDELELSLEAEAMTDNLINELGDVLFCVLGKPALSEALIERLSFDMKRADAYIKVDDLKAQTLEDGAFRKALDNLKLTPAGWVNKDKTPVDNDLLEMLPQI